MKTKFLAIGFLFICLIAPLWGQSKTTGLLPTPKGLQQASQPAVMSGINLRSEGMPSMVDLAEGKIIARDQGVIGSCGSFATSNAFTLMRRISAQLPISNRSWHSPSFLYNQVMVGNDQGSTYYDNLEIAKNAGIATAVTFPYTTNVRLLPGQNAFREAQLFKINEWRWIQHDDVNTFRSFLAKGYPIMLVVKVFENLFDYNGGIYYPAGLLSETYHGVLVTGYDDSFRTFTAINSWGDRWGEKGFFKFSYQTLSNSGSLVIAAYIMVPAAQNSAAPLFPAGVEASKGTLRDKVIIKWQSVPNALEYEVFRLDSAAPADPREEQYISMGMTSGAVFEDLSVRQDHRYFYLVRTHMKNISSDLSFPVEGWSSAIPNNPPGPPSGFSTIIQNNTVVCAWDSVENAERYIVYLWKSNDWFKVGDTIETTFIDSNPVSEGKASISYFVVAENRWGKSVPSNVSSVMFDSDSADNNSNADDVRKERYNGGFYLFPVEKFIQAEKAFLADFKRNTREFEERFKRDHERFRNYFGGR